MVSCTLGMQGDAQFTQERSVDDGAPRVCVAGALIDLDTLNKEDKSQHM
jgi:hypothetical protein